MILNRPLLYDLTQGDEARIPTADDATLILPPVLQPVVLALRSTVLLTQPPNPTLSGSAMFDFFQARVNGVATTSSMVTLPKGLWELELSMATSFDYTPVPPLTNLSPVEIQLSNSLSTIVIVSRFPAIGSHQDFNRLRLLLLEPTSLNLFVPLTGVTDDLAVQLSCNCIRIL